MVNANDDVEPLVLDDGGVPVDAGAGDVPEQPVDDGAGDGNVFQDFFGWATDTIGNLIGAVIELATPLVAAIAGPALIMFLIYRLVIHDK